MNDSRDVTYECDTSHMNESCHIWMRHITYKWVTSCMNDSCHTFMRHRVTSHMNASCHVIYEWLTSRHVWKRHVTYECLMSHLNESRKYEYVTSLHTWMPHVILHEAQSHRVTSHMNKSRYIWMSRGNMSTSRHFTNECLTLHFMTHRVTSHMHESRHIWISHVTYERVTSPNTEWPKGQRDAWGRAERPLVAANIQGDCQDAAISKRYLNPRP